MNINRLSYIHLTIYSIGDFVNSTNHFVYLFLYIRYKISCKISKVSSKMEPAKGFEPMKLTRRVTSAFLLTTQVNRHMVDRIGIEPMTSCLQSRRSPSWTNSPYGGFNGSRTHLYTVTVYYTNRYTMKPKILCLHLVLFHPSDFFTWTFNAYWETLFLLWLYRVVTPTKTL